MAKLYDENFSKSLMSFGKSFSRLNGQPLDDSSVYFSYEEAATYAASAAAYVGQPIAVIDIENNTAKLYLIENSAGSLQEIGTNVEFEDTNTTYSLTLERDEEKKGTKVIFASNVEGEEAVDFFVPDVYDDNSIIEELGKKANADEVYSVEELNTLLDDKANVLDVYTKTETDEKIGKAVAAADHLRRKIINSKEDIDVTANDVMQYIYMVPSGLQSSDNKYYEYIVLEENGTKYVEQVGNWEVDLKDYLTVASANETYAKKNDVAATYVSNTGLAETLEDYVTDQELTIALNDYAKSSEIPTDYVSDEEIQAYDTAEIAAEKYASKNETYTKEEVDEFLEDKVDVLVATSDNGIRFINQTEINKLSKLNLDGEDITISGSVNASQVKELYATVTNIVKGSTADLDPDTEGNQLGLGIQEGAQVNFIDNINTDVFSIDDDKKLDLVKVPVGKLDGLETWVEENRDVVTGLYPTTAVTLLNNLDNAINNEETGLIAGLTAVKAKVLTNENSIKNHADRLDTLEYAMTWHDIENI